MSEASAVAQNEFDQVQETLLALGLSPDLLIPAIQNWKRLVIEAVGYLNPAERRWLHLAAEIMAISRTEAMMAPLLNWQQVVIRYLNELRQVEAYVLILVSFSQERIEQVSDHIRHLARERGRSD